MRKEPRPSKERIKEAGFSVKELRVGAVPEPHTARTDRSYHERRTKPTQYRPGSSASSLPAERQSSASRPSAASSGSPTAASIWRTAAAAATAKYDGKSAESAAASTDDAATATTLAVDAAVQRITDGPDGHPGEGESWGTNQQAGWATTPQPGTGGPMGWM